MNTIFRKLYISSSPNSRVEYSKGDKEKGEYIEIYSANVEKYDNDAQNKERFYEVWHRLI
jgi:hypothetical protein